MFVLHPTVKAQQLIYLIFVCIFCLSIFKFIRFTTWKKLFVMCTLQSNICKKKITFILRLKKLCMFPYTLPYFIQAPLLCLNFRISRMSLINDFFENQISSCNQQPYTVNKPTVLLYSNWRNYILELCMIISLILLSLSRGSSSPV